MTQLRTRYLVVEELELFDWSPSRLTRVFAGQGAQRAFDLLVV